MAYMTISTVVTDPVADGTALEAAAELARRNDGHLDVLCLGLDHTQPGVYYSGATAVAMQTNFAEAKAHAAEIENVVNSLLDGRDLKWSTQAICAQVDGLSSLLARYMRFTDIAVLSKPYGENRGHEVETIVESALFDAEIPVLIIPDNCDLPARFDRIVIAWNESREAMTATRKALPFLTEASATNIAIIDPPDHAPDRSDPGGALSRMLVRHSVKSEVSILAKTMPRIADVIERHVRDQDADLLVMGAYGHSRFRESILGGATRNTLQNASFPVFMAH